MYKKLLYIKNYGRFANYSSKSSDWDGTFQKINIIYAPNGSGKTSLAELFRSTSGDSDIITRKQGIFRIKYFKYVNENQWLGDFIQIIRDANINTPFHRLKQYLSEIEEINDYSKTYHHSNPNYIEVGISAIELKNYVKRTLALIENL